MDIISQVLEILVIKEIKVVTVADTASKYIDGECLAEFEINRVDDVRSAGFFALGKTQTLQRPTVLFVESRYIDSLYTSLVEIWFQQMPVVVVVFDINDGVDYSLYVRCIKEFNDLRSGPLCDLKIAKDGPTLIIVPGKPVEDNESYSNIEELLPNGAIIYKPIDKYGAISKYSGFLCGTDQMIYCSIPLEWIKWDLNIFNNRYIDKRFKLILRGDFLKTPCELKQWLEANQITLIEGQDKKAIEFFVNNQKPSVIIIK